MFSGDECYDDEITSGPWQDLDECGDCYPFECRGFSTCDECNPFDENRED